MNLSACSRSTVAVVALASLATACSSPPPAAPDLHQTVERTSFVGSCRGMEVGTYVFTFGPTIDHRGTVQVTFPDPAKGTRRADYTVNYPDRGQQLTVSLSPQWTGPFIRDAENLKWNALVGDPAQSGQCRMWEAGSATH